MCACEPSGGSNRDRQQHSGASSALDENRRAISIINRIFFILADCTEVAITLHAKSQMNQLIEDLEREELAPPRAVSPIWRLVANPDQIIVKLNGKKIGLPLYFVHSLSGEVTSYNQFAKALGSSHQVYGIQATKKVQGRVVSAIETLAAKYVHVLTSYQSEGPFVLGGWSVGAVIALEMAHQLRAQGREIPLLVVIDGELTNTGGGVMASSFYYYWQIICNMPRWIAQDLIGEAPSILRRARNKLNVTMQGYRKGERSSYHKIDTFLDTRKWPEAQIVFAKTLYESGRSYTPKTYHGRVIVYTARTQPLFHPLQVAETWVKICPLAEAVRINGTHSSLLREPQVHDLTKHLREQLEQLRPDTRRNGASVESYKLTYAKYSTSITDGGRGSA